MLLLPYPYLQVEPSSSPLMSGFIDFGSELDSKAPYTQELDAFEPIVDDMTSQVGIFYFYFLPA